MSSNRHGEHLLSIKDHEIYADCGSQYFSVCHKIVPNEPIYIKSKSHTNVHNFGNTWLSDSVEYSVKA